MKTPSLCLSLPADPIFFRKEDIKTNCRLMYYGVKDPMSEWKITKIISYFTTDVRGKWEQREVPQVRHLDDDVYLVNINNRNMKLKLTFGYMRYSAIWRLA
jgi:hypothetical protein